MISRARFGRSIALPLCVALSTLACGCSKVEALVANLRGDDDPLDATPEAAEPDPGDDVAAPVPEVPLADLDTLLAFLPDADVQALVIQDASMLPDLIDEGIRFADAPMKRLAERAETLPPALKRVVMQYREIEQQARTIAAALRDSKIVLEQGIVVFEDAEGTSHVIFHSFDPEAATALATAFGASGVNPEQCGPIEGHRGWNVCSRERAAYRPSTDSAPVRARLEALFPGVDVEAAHVLFHNLGRNVAGAISIDAGQLHAAFATHEGSSYRRDVDELAKVLHAGPPEILGDLEPGAGFFWGRTDPTAISAFADRELAGAPKEIVEVFKSLTGEWLVGGSAQPPGVVARAGSSNPSAFAHALRFVQAMAALAPKQIPGVPGAELVIDRGPLAQGAEDALHVGLVGRRNRVFAGATMLALAGDLHFDAWAFPGSDAINIVAGSSRDAVTQLASAETKGAPAKEVLALLPTALSTSLVRGEVSFAVHMPLDVAQHPSMRTVVERAFAQKPLAGLDAAALDGLLDLAVPFSSASVWALHPAEGPRRLHIHVRTLGVRSTEEGTAALEAAHAVANGADPEAEFGPLVERYPSSSMHHAYETRVGIPEGLSRSGWGTLAAMAAATHYAMRGGKPVRKPKPAAPASRKPAATEKDSGKRPAKRGPQNPRTSHPRRKAASPAPSGRRKPNPQ